MTDERAFAPDAPSASEADAAFRALPDEARVWVFGTDRSLDDAEEARLLREVDDFLQAWKAHGHPLAAGRAWLRGRFLVVAVDEAVEPPSGCSIDALVRHLRELESDLGLAMVGGGPVHLLAGEGGGEVEQVGRAEFRRRARAGEVDGETPVFDLTVDRLGAVRGGRFLLPAARSWHRALLPDPVPEATPDSA